LYDADAFGGSLNRIFPKPNVRSKEVGMNAGRKTHGLFLFLAIGTAFCLAAVSQQAALNTSQVDSAVQAQARSLSLSQAMPVDPQITIGKFSNGLRYYIRANKLPEKCAELRLAVSAGSVLEDDDQLGLAHMVEHMLSNGTRHFSKQPGVTYMNAETSFDETVYMLTVRTDTPGVMDKAFLILEDWTRNVSFDPAEIEKERGVIVEERRLGRGADARMQDIFFPILFKGSRYADRPPIGKKEMTETVKPDVLKRFYKDWYRPDLMAVIAVGDFDINAVERLIKEHFEIIPAAAVPRLRPSYNIPDHPDTLYAVATDKEATMPEISIYNKLPLEEQSSVGVYRQEIAKHLAANMLGDRLSDLVQKPDSQFAMAAAAWSIFVRTKEAAMLNAIPREGGTERALETLLTEAARAAKYGFTATELDREKLQALRRYEQYFVETDKRQSATLAAELIRNFTQNETLPSPAMEYALNQRFLPKITLKEVNRFAGVWLNRAGRVIVVISPEKPGVAAPDETKLAAVVKAVGKKKIAAYVDTMAGQALLDKPPAPGKIVNTTVKDAYGITEWELSNGVKVVLKPTTLKQDEIVFRATKPGGYQLAGDQDFIPAKTAAQVMSVTGSGKFSAIDLRKVLAGKIASVSPLISDIDEGLSGDGSVKDIETMFQLIYLRFTQPRADKEAFAAHIAQGKAVLANQQQSPEYVFSETLQKILTQDHPRARPMTVEMIDRMNLESSLAFYRDRFADASDFTFVFVGSFTPEMMKPLVERYLASLPALHRMEFWKDVGIRFPQGVVEKTIVKGLEPKSQVAIVFSGPFQYDQKHRVAILALGMVLDWMLDGLLREDLGGTYSVRASPSYEKVPVESYTFAIQFGCDPKRADELVKKVFEQVEALKRNGPDQEMIADIREQLIRDFETNTQQNSYLLSQILLWYQYSEDLGTFFGLRDYYKTLNARIVWDAARTYLNLDNYAKVILLPETKTQAGSREPENKKGLRMQPAA
jgi:zinc protease